MSSLASLSSRLCNRTEGENHICTSPEIEIHGSLYCFKSIHRGVGEHALERELPILPSNIICFIGLIEPADEKDKVEGR